MAEVWSREGENNDIQEGAHSALAVKIHDSIY